MRFAIANQKGGVGKTATVLGLADAAQLAGINTCIVDMDPQANATAATVDDLERTTNDLLALDDPDQRRGSWEAAVVSSRWDTALVSVIPSERGLAAREPERPLGYETRLRDALEGIDEVFGLVLIDCPPALGRLAVSGLVAADAALLVSEPAAASIAGLVEVRQTIDTVREHVKGADQLRIAGVLVNMVDERETEARYSIAELGDVFGDLVLPTRIPDATVISQAYRAGAPVSAYWPGPRAIGRAKHPAVRASTAYSDVLDRLLQKPAAKPARRRRKTA